MSVGDFINKAKGLVSGHPDQARQAMDRVEQVINDRTGGKYADKVAKGGDMLEERLGMSNGRQGGAGGQGRSDQDQDLTRDQPSQTQQSTPSDDEMQGGSQGSVNPGQSPGPGLG